MQDQLKRYELAYLLSQHIQEDEKLLSAGKLAKLIEEVGGTIRHQEIPQKRRLAFPVRKEHMAYFGWITFAAARETPADLRKRLKFNESLLRYSIVEEEEMPLRTRPLRVLPTTTLPAQVRPAAADAPEAKLDLEELDKKLEEILGK